MPMRGGPAPRVPSDIARNSLFAAIGDSIVKASSSASLFGGDSFFVLGCMMSSGRMRPYINAGVGGDTTAQMLARIDADVINARSPRPGRCLVMGGTNDVSAAVPLATTLGNLARMYDKLRAAGIEPIGATIPPRGLYHPQIAAINAGIRTLCNRRGMHCLGMHEVLTNPITGNYKDTFANADGVHPVAPGIRAMATVLATLAAEFPLNAPFLTDDKTDTTNMLANGVFDDAGASGGVASGWTLQGSGGTVTPTIETGDANIVGNWQVLTTTVSGQRLLRAFPQSNAASPAGWAAGDVLEISGLISTSVEAGAAIGPEVRVLFGGPGTLESAVYALSVDLTRGVFYRRFTVPPGVTTPSGLSVNLYNGTGTGGPWGTSVVKFGRLTLINLTRLGLI